MLCMINYAIITIKVFVNSGRLIKHHRQSAYTALEYHTIENHHGML